MPMKANPWYSNQVMAQVGQNLAAAIYGDPDAKYKASADQRATADQMMREEAHRAQQEELSRRQQGRERFARGFAGDDDALAQALLGAIDAGADPMQALVLAGQQDPRFKQRLAEMDHAQGHRVELQDDSQAHDASMQSSRFAHDRRMEGQRHIYRTGEMGLESALGLHESQYQAGIDRDARAEEFGYNIRRDASLHAQDIATMNIEQELARALYQEFGATPRGFGGSGRGYKPAGIAPGAMDDVEDTIVDAIEKAAGGSVTLQPNERAAVLARVTELYQATNNWPTAVEQGIREVLQFKDGKSAVRMNPEYGAAPGGPQQPAAAGQQADPNQLLQDARDAISQGAPRDAVISELKKMGIDPSGL